MHDTIKDQNSSQLIDLQFNNRGHDSFLIFWLDELLHHLFHIGRVQQKCGKSEPAPQKMQSCDNLRVLMEEIVNGFDAIGRIRREVSLIE